LSPSSTSSLLLLAKTITHPAARSLCDSWAYCYLCSPPHLSFPFSLPLPFLSTYSQPIMVTGSRERLSSTVIPGGTRSPNVFCAYFAENQASGKVATILMSFQVYILILTNFVNPCYLASQRWLWNRIFGAGTWNTSVLSSCSAGVHDQCKNDQRNQLHSTVPV